jgi:hypothetical protein
MLHLFVVMHVSISFYMSDVKVKEENLNKKILKFHNDKKKFFLFSFFKKLNIAI